MNEWISVKDRLPEERVLVLSIDDFGTMKVDSYHRSIKSFFQATMHGRKVTHWMPLPEPPKEETE